MAASMHLTGAADIHEMPTHQKCDRGTVCARAERLGTGAGDSLGSLRARVASRH